MAVPTQRINSIPLNDLGNPSQNGADVVVYEGSSPRKFTDEDEFRTYLREYPESENDCAARVFRYTPTCPPKLKVALFEKFQYERLQMLPLGSYYPTPTLNTNPNTGKCECETCQDGAFCGFYGLEYGASFWQLESVTIDPNNRLEITGGTDSVSIYAGDQKTTFRLASWNLQVFRFPARRIEHTDHAFDVLLYQDTTTSIKVQAVPLQYIIDFFEEVLQNWEALLAHSTRFLSFFAIEILSSRLETDRRVIRHLLGAAQFWSSLSELMGSQSKALAALCDGNRQRWLEGEPENSVLTQTLSLRMQHLNWLREQINQRLVSETDLLIQRITNLISIDEGYRSRDQNESIKRLSWITFIFLPLIFATGIFGMNVDAFKNNPSLVYYAYFIIPLCGLVALLWAFIRYGRAIVSKIGSLWRLRHQHDVESEPLVSDNTVLGWAARTGQRDLVGQALRTGHIQEDRRDESLLIRAVRNVRTEVAQMLLRDGNVDVNSRDAEGAAALHYAARNSSLPLVEALLSAGADVEAKDNQGETPLDLSIQSRSEKCTALLLRFKYGNFEAGSALQLACLAHDQPLFDQLRAMGFSTGLRDAQGRTAIFGALESSDCAFMRHVINQGLDIHLVDKEGLTVLHVAVQLDDLDVVKLLLDSGSLVNARSSQGERPLHFVDRGHGSNSRNILVALLDKGADINAIDNTGQTLGHILVENSARPEFLDFYAESGGDLGISTDVGETVSHVAARNGNVQLLGICIKRSPASLLVKNKFGAVPLAIAVSMGNTTMIEMISKTEEGRKSARGIDVVGKTIDVAIKSDNVDLLKAAHEKYPVFPGVRSGPSRGAASSSDRERDQELRRQFDNAVTSNAIAVTTYLLDQGCFTAWAGEQDAGGWLPRLIQRALENGSIDTALVLIKRGAPTDVADDRDGWTCLHSAAFAGSFECADLLASRVKDKAVKDRQGWTALDLAAFYRHDKIVELLHPAHPVQYAWQKREPLHLRYRAGATEGPTGAGLASPPVELA